MATARLSDSTEIAEDLLRYFVESEKQRRHASQHAFIHVMSFFVLIS